MYNRSGTQAYAQVSLESGAMSASPHQLIVMLFDGALSALLRARILMNQGDIAGKGLALSKAINIIDNGLKGGLTSAGRRDRRKPGGVVRLHEASVNAGQPA